MKELSVVVPVYNEIECIELLCEKLHENVSRLGRTYEIVLVDDGSTDGTWEKLVVLADRYPHLRLIRFRTNFGQTAAMSAGFRESQGEIVVTLDADLQNDPADIPMLVEHMEQGGFDVVSGWRKNRKDRFFSRRLPSMMANKLISKMTGVALHDYGCTLKAYRRTVMKDVHLYGEMHRFIPALAKWVGGTVDEVVVNHHPRRLGTSKYGISHTSRVALDLLTVKFLLHYSRGPMQIFGKIGMLFGGPGLLMATVMILAHIAYNLGLTSLEPFIEIIKRPVWTIMPFMLVLFCIQFISMGLLAEIQIRTWHESQDKPIYTIREIVQSPSKDG